MDLDSLLMKENISHLLKTVPKRKLFVLMSVTFQQSVLAYSMEIYNGWDRQHHLLLRMSDTSLHKWGYLNSF